MSLIKKSFTQENVQPLSMYFLVVRKIMIINSKLKAYFSLDAHQSSKGFYYNKYVINNVEL